MAQRKTGMELSQLKQDNNVEYLWSWSKLNRAKSDPYGYFLNYIKHIPEDHPDQSIYSYAGSLVHDLIESFYKGETTKEQMLEVYNDKVIDFELEGYKFDRDDEEKNESIGNKYHTCNRHFIKHFTKINGKDIKLEDFVTAKIGNFLIQGYIDCSHVETIDGVDNLILTDWKTSSIYTGEKVKKEAGQLLLYAIGAIQQGWDIEDVSARWAFTKYCIISMPLKNGSMRESKISRHEIGDKLYSNAKMWLKAEKSYEESEIEQILNEMMITNDIECLPDSIREKYTISDCYVEVEITQDILDELMEDIKSLIVSTVKKEMEYKRNGDDKVFWTEIDASNVYFFAKLSGYSHRLHLPYAQYLENINMFKTKEEDNDELSIDDLMAELDLD